MSFFTTLQEMVVILFAVAVGALANRLGYMNGDTDRKLSKLILNITIPCLVIASVIRQESLPEPKVILSVLLVSAVFYLMEFAFAFVVPRLVGGTPGQRGVWRFLMCFPNIGFIGYPLVQALFGDEGFFYAVILALPFNILNFSMGPLLLSGKFRFSWRQFCTPSVICSFIALTIALFDIPMPAMVGEMAGLVGDVTVPLSLLVLGSMLAGMSVRSVLTSWRLWVLSFIRLLVEPATLSLLLHLMGVDPLILGVAVAQMAMPAAVNGSMLCLEHGGDTDAMVQSIFLSTVLAIVTIPVAAALFM